MKINKIVIALSAAILINYSTITTYANIDQEFQTDSKTLLKKVRNQLSSIDLTLEEFAQAANNNGIKLEDKKQFRDYIAQIRLFIDKLSKNEYLDIKESNIQKLLEINKTLLNHLHVSISTDLKKLSVFDELAIIDQIIHKKYDPINTDAAEELLNKYNDQLENMIRKFNKVGSSSLNVFVKDSESILKNLKLHKVAKRALPYLGLGVYWLALQDSTYISDLGWSPLIKVKRLLGTVAKDKECTESTAPPAQPGQQVEGRPSSPAGIKKTKMEYAPGVVGTTSAYLKSFVTFEGLKPLITFSIAGIIAPKVQKDLADVGSWSLKQGKRAYCYLKGEPFEDESPIKPGKLKFDDIIGYDYAKKELSKVVNYFKSRQAYDLTGTQADFGYLIAGPLDISKSLAQAVAGEASKLFKSLGKKTICSLYEIHSSQLLDKKLKDIVKEIEEEEAAPCIIVINELDWLCSQKNVDSKVWADITTTISKTIRNHKKQIFIISTVQNVDALSQVEQSNLGVKIQLAMPSIDDRKQFFKKELSNRCVNTSRFDVESLVQQTENCSYAQLTAIAKRALALAHTQGEILNQIHLEQSINEIVHKIIAKEIPAEQKQLLAAHFAGKALAHYILKPQSKLIKVTTLPIATKTATQDGGLILFNPEYNKAYITNSELEKECLIELAGIQAQKLLLNKVCTKLSEQAKEYVMTQISRNILEGINIQKLPKTIKEEKLKAVWDFAEQLSKEAADLIAQHKTKLQSIFENLESKSILTAQEIKNLIK